MLRFRKFLCNNIFPGTYYSWILPSFSFKQQYSKHTSLKSITFTEAASLSLQPIIFKICWVQQIICFLLILKIMPGKTPPLYTCALYTQPPSQWRIQTITDKTWSHCPSAWGSKKTCFWRSPFFPSEMDWIIDFNFISEDFPSFSHLAIFQYIQLDSTCIVKWFNEDNWCFSQSHQSLIKVSCPSLGTVVFPKGA